MSNSYHCKICEIHVSVKKNWIQHLLKPEHQSNAKKCSQEWDRKMRKRILVTFCEEGFDKPTSFLTRVIRYFSVGDVSSVANFIRRKEKPHVGIVQFESRKKLKEMLSSLKSRHLFKINNRVIQIKRAIRVSDMEWNVLIGSTRGIEKLMWGKDSRPWKSILSTPEESGKVHVVTISDNEDDDDEEIEVIQHLCAVKKAVTPASDNAVSTSDAGNELKQPTETSVVKSNDEVERPANKKRKTDNEAKKSSSSSSPKSSCPTGILARLVKKNRWKKPKFELSFLNPSAPGHVVKYLFRVKLNGTIYEPNLSAASTSKKMARHNAVSYCLKCLKKAPNSRTKEVPIIAAEADSNSNVTNVTIVAQKDAAGVTVVAAADSTTSPENSPESPDIIILSNEEVYVAPSLTVPKSLTPEVTESKRSKCSIADEAEANKNKSATSEEPESSKRKSSNAKHDEAQINISTTSKEPESSKRKSSNSKHDEGEKDKSVNSKEPESSKRRSSNSKHDDGEKNKPSTSKEPESSKRKSSNSKHDEGEKDKSTTSKEPDSSKRKSSNSKHDEAEKDKSVNSKEPESMKRKSSNSKHDETQKNKSTTSKEPEPTKRKSSNSKHDEAEKSKSTTYKEPDTTKRKSQNSKQDETHKNKSTTSKEPEPMKRKSQNSQHDDEGQKNKATTSKEPEPKSPNPKPDEAQKNNSTTPKSVSDRHSKQLNSDFDFSAIFKSVTGKEGPAGTKSKVYQAQVTKNSVQKTVSPSARVPSINLSLLENQFTSIIKSIQIPMEEFNVALSLVQRIESCLVSDYRPSCKVTMFRNWHLQLRHSASNDLLIYVYSLEDGNGTSNFNSLPVEAVANVLLKTTKGRTLLPDIKPLPSKDKTIGRQFVHSPTGLSFQIVTPAWYIVEVQMCRLVRYLCQFDPRCKPLITLVYYWAKVNNVQVGQTVNPSMYYNAPEPAALEWLVISFLVILKEIPSPREVYARSKHLPLLVFDSRSDIGFARNEEYRREWIASRPPIENNIWNVLILAEKFFSFMSSNLHPSSNWLLNTRDGEILNLKYFATNTAWSEKLGVVEQMALRELATHPEKAQRVNLKNFEGLYVMHPLYLTWRLSVCNWRLTNGIMQETSKELKKVVKLQTDQALNGNITEAPFDLKAVLEVKGSVRLEIERKILDKSKRNSSSKNSKSSTIQSPE